MEEIKSEIKPAARGEGIMPIHGTFNFKCSPGVGCFTRCCGDVTIVLTPYDILRLKNRLGIGSEDFIRVRIGIGRPNPDSDNPGQDNPVIDYVLSDFSTEENQLMQQIIMRVNDAVESLVCTGLEPTMNEFNSQRR